MHLKGTLPALILHTLAGGPKHGYLIAQEIKAKSKGVLDFKEGSLYPALHGLENDGYIESVRELVDGRPRRNYRLTEHGVKQLEDERAEWQELSRAVSVILEGS